MKSAGAAKLYTVDEYFELEANSEVRYEYVEGKLIEMPGEPLSNLRISRNILLKLHNLLEPRGCEAFELGAKTATVKNKKFRYPDVVVICQPELDERFIQNPCICVEVLSDSTEKTDKNDKLWEYCNLLSMLHYLIVSSDEPKIELYTRNTEGWQVTFIEGMNSSVFLKHFELQLPLKEVYKNVRFGEPKSDI